MIKVTIGTNTNRKAVNVDPNRTIKSVLDEQGINYTTGTLHLDGATLQPGEINKTFADFGITDSCYLISVVKADNAH
jgi:hypothetical protein